MIRGMDTFIEEKYHLFQKEVMRFNCIDSVLQFKDEYIQLKNERTLDMKINHEIKKYNQYMDVLKDIKFSLKYDKNKEKKKKLSNMMIKFGFNNKNDLICLFCDYDNSLQLKPHISPLQSFDIHVLYGDYHKNKRKEDRLSMNIGYEIEHSNVTLMNIQAGKKTRCGHGSFALKHLECIVQEINNRIIRYNKRFGNRIEERKYIDGSIVAIKKNVTKGDLIRFYKKCNYYEDGKIYKEIKP